MQVLSPCFGDGWFADWAQWSLVPVEGRHLFGPWACWLTRVQTCCRQRRPKRCHPGEPATLTATQTQMHFPCAPTSLRAPCPLPCLLAFHGDAALTGCEQAESAAGSQKWLGLAFRRKTPALAVWRATLLQGVAGLDECCCQA